METKISDEYCFHFRVNRDGQLTSNPLGVSPFGGVTIVLRPKWGYLSCAICGIKDRYSRRVGREIAQFRLKSPKFCTPYVGSMIESEFLSAARTFAHTAWNDYLSSFIRRMQLQLMKHAIAQTRNLPPVIANQIVDRRPKIGR